MHSSAKPLALPFWPEGLWDTELQGGLVGNVFAYPLPQSRLQGATPFHPTFFHPAAKPIQIGGMSQLCAVGFQH